jgi:hypothetical protein
MIQCKATQVVVVLIHPEHSIKGGIHLPAVVDWGHLVGLQVRVNAEYVNVCVCPCVCPCVCGW